jgi:dipeptidase
MVALGDATENGQTLFAKTSDRSPEECQPLVQQERISHPAGAVAQCQFVELPQVGTTWRHVGSRPCWCWGYEHGFNEHQVVIGNEGLASKLEFSEPKLIGMEVLRLGLERARTAAEAVDVMTDLVTRYGQGKFSNDANVRTYDNGYIVADPREAYVIETAGHQWAVKQVENAIGISNVYSVETDWDRTSPEAETLAAEQGWWSARQGRFNFAEAYAKNRRPEGTGAMRRARSCAVLKKCGIDAATMMALLSDHSDGKAPDEPFQTGIHPGAGICVHQKEDGTGGNTAASLVADLCADGSRLPVYWCSLYSPCLGVFLPMFNEGTLPLVLGIGDASPSDESPWWLFRSLSRNVRRNPETRVPAVREQWEAFQGQLFETAYEVAREGRRLLDDGRTARASRLLTDYMAENASTTLALVSEMLMSFT